MRFKTMKNKEGGMCLRRVVYVVMDENFGINYYFDTKEEAEADCEAGHWVQEFFYDEVVFEGETK